MFLFAIKMISYTLRSGNGWLIPTPWVLYPLQLSITILESKTSGKFRVFRSTCYQKEKSLVLWRKFRWDSGKEPVEKTWPFQGKDFKEFGKEFSKSGKATSYENLGTLFRSLGQYDEAREYQEKALAIRIEICDREKQQATKT